jgi:hypothetical protein
MNIRIAQPQNPLQYGRRKVSRMFPLIWQLSLNPEGRWLSVDLDDVAGSSTTAKQNSAAQAVRRHFRKPVQVQVEGQHLFIRRIPDPNKPCVAQPIDWSKNGLPVHRPRVRPNARPVFYRPGSGQDSQPDRGLSATALAEGGAGLRAP